MKIHSNKFSTIIMLSLMTLLMASAVYATEEPSTSPVAPSTSPARPRAHDATSIKEGTYIGLYLTSNQMSGDFDDSTSYSTYDEFLDVPDVDSGTGIGAVLGFRVPKGALELGYQRSSHDVSGVIHEEGDAKYNIIDLNFKIDVLARNQIRPYLLFGFGFPWLTIENSLYDYYSGWEDATFFGLALNVGAGAAYYFRPDLAVDGGILYRWNRFSSAEGKSLDESLIETTLCFRIGLAYTF